MARSKSQLVSPVGDRAVEGSVRAAAAASPARSLFEVVSNLARSTGKKPVTSMARSKSLLVRPAAAEQVAPQSRPATMIEAFNFMRGIMDECTHLANFPVPVDPTLALIVQARDDAYVPRDGLTSLTELWPGSSVRFLDTGHVAAYLFNQDAFRVAIADTFDKMIHKYNL